MFNGFRMTFLPIADVADQLAWVNDMPELLVRFIGVAELAGGLGLVLPAIARILPWLTTLAATGLGVNMVLAAVFHVSRSEFTNIIVPIIILVLATFVALGRWKKAPIAARS